MKGSATFSNLLEAFFLERLMQQRRVSPHTIASYRDTFRLLLQFTQKRLRKTPSCLAVSDLTTELVGEFLSHLEKDRRNTARSRNVRLAAIHSFFRYVARQAPEYSGIAQRLLDIPSKRYTRRLITFLTQVEIDALLAAPDLDTWCGRRDRALILLAVQTGLRAAELLGLRCKDVVLGSAAHVRCDGKGRKERCTPLRKDTVRVLRGWLKERQGKASDPVFPTVRGTAMSHDALRNLLNKHVSAARRHCASLKKKHVTPHSLRHSLAMQLLQNGVDRSVIALWLGHECRGNY
jgi:integrase/recombinase XerD